MSASLEQYLLTRLAGEAAEVGQAAEKAFSYGMEDTWPEKRAGTNRENLRHEIHDLIAVAELVGVIDPDETRGMDRTLIDAKKAKVERYLDYSRQRGRLEYEVET